MTVARSAELVRHRSGATGSFRSVNSRRGGIHLPALIGVGGGLLLSVQFTRSFIIPARSASQKEHCSVRPAFRPDSANKYQSRLIDADWFGFHWMVSFVDQLNVAIMTAYLEIYNNIITGRAVICYTTRTQEAVLWIFTWFNKPTRQHKCDTRYAISKLINQHGKWITVRLMQILLEPVIYKRFLN